MTFSLKSEKDIIQKKGQIYKEPTTQNFIVIAVLEVSNSVKKQKGYAMMTLMKTVERVKMTDCTKLMGSYLKSEHKRNTLYCSFSVIMSLMH